MAECSIEGLKELAAKLDKLSGSSRSVFEKGIKRGLELVKDRAQLLCPVNEGELRNSIKTSVKSAEGGLEGICYTNKEHAFYVEFGTGPKGQQAHSGTSPEFTPSYKQRGWAFPASAITSGPYHFPETEYNGVKYFITRGQAAQPFMYPVLKDGECEVLEEIKETIGRGLKEF